MARFVEAAINPQAFTCKARTRQGSQVSVNISGAILVWGGVTEEGRNAAMRTFGFADVLSLESIINDLQRARDARFSAFVRERLTWCQEMFASLIGGA
jgi:hypothetical protein